MNRGGWDAEFILRDSPGEAEAGGDQNSLARHIIVGYCIVGFAQTIEHDIEDGCGSFGAMPQQRIGQRGAEFFDRAQGNQFQSNSVCDFTEEGIGDDFDIVTVRFEREAKTDVRMDIAGATDGEEEDFHSHLPSLPGVTGDGPENYICWGCSIPSSSNPHAMVLAVASHNVNRLDRNGSSLCSTGQFSKNPLNRVASSYRYVQR